PPPIFVSAVPLTAKAIAGKTRKPLGGAGRHDLFLAAASIDLGRVDAANPYVRGDVLAEPDVNARLDRVAIDDPDDFGLEWTGQDRSAGKRRRSNQYKKQ